MVCEMQTYSCPYKAQPVTTICSLIHFFSLYRLPLQFVLKIPSDFNIIFISRYNSISVDRLFSLKISFCDVCDTSVKLKCLKIGQKSLLNANSYIVNKIENLPSPEHKSLILKVWLKSIYFLNVKLFQIKSTVFSLFFSRGYIYIGKWAEPVKTEMNGGLIQKGERNWEENAGIYLHCHSCSVRSIN